MVAQVLFAAGDKRWRLYEAPLREALEAAGIACELATDLPRETVEYIVYAPDSELQDFSVFPRLKAVLNLWAGVEGVVGNKTLTVPLARMVDDEGLTQGMVEWVTGHALRHHLGMDAHIINPGHVWRAKAPPLASDRPVTVLGLGVLGAACGQALARLGFPVTGWSRTAKQLDGLRCLHGADGLDKALRGAQVVVLLLPDTPATRNLLNAERLALLAPGAFILNPGRGTLIDDEALLAALDGGQVGHATLDVFRTEPLPRGHPFWAHPRVTVTPHIASETRIAPAARVVAENIRRGEAGAPFLHLVDRAAGY
ncbi:glyoxylate/hydroxypyruvate reductase A [Thalassococcus sp. CAU 1522]|uniref:Glyoxylate/hydroxypyruvate reductase A n=1 Tax=Thalassococcus arenae TaxID=2851652 RepID=A0ABS6N8C6_9RHOB|nr:glyoxylate/hydroxypyruvate reductase A [Thalassococcus arenae]MBV2360274.1 glyoxylate/hydroxypyruvate reductase A [Thalassococcus arenae]